MYALFLSKMYVNHPEYIQITYYAIWFVLICIVKLALKINVWFSNFHWNFLMILVAILANIVHDLWFYHSLCIIFLVKVLVYTVMLVMSMSQNSCVSWLFLMAKFSYPHKHKVTFFYIKWKEKSCTFLQQY